MNDAEIFSILEKPLNEFIKKAECRNKTASKPGGQRVNKKETAVLLSFPSNDISVMSKEYRSREANLKHAANILRLKLAVLVKSLPEDSFIQKYQCYFINNLKVNIKNPAIACVFAVISGTFNHFKGDHKEVSSFLKVSNSCLCKFVCSHKMLHEKINNIRNKYQICSLRS